jgi:hypothetical protein
MASCAPPANSACAALAALLLAAAPPAAANEPSPPAQAAEHPADPLETLRKARQGQIEAGEARGPSAIPVPSEAQRRRAFEGLRKRAADPGIEARARAGLDQARRNLGASREATLRGIGEAIGLDTPDLKALTATGSAPAAKAWVPVLFASSSMPVTTLRNYAAQLAKARGVIAFRGMPGGLTKVAPMARLAAEVLRIDPGCEGPACAMRDVELIVDPLLFRQHGVTRVPALTMLPGDPARPYCERDEESPVGSHLVLGDAALDGMLEEYARLGGKEEVGDAAARLESR